MASAPDIITYIGVPLAVLGVLPIMYTFAFAIITQRRIRASLLLHGHKPLSSSQPHDGFSIRSSPMTSLIEVELPRYTIALHDRNNDEYWKANEPNILSSEDHHRLLERVESTLSMIEEGRVQGFLRGGSWRAFRWKKLIVGRKLYRIQYEDELREPPAEIDFSELIHFLLDWGAVPDPMGWEKLRSGGLWTPSGTILLRKPEDENLKAKRRTDWVLRTSVPDDSDGVLTLCIRWSRDFNGAGPIRDPTSLPPGWGRLVEPVSDNRTSNLEKKEQNQEENQEKKKCLCSRVEALKSSTKECMDSNSFRFRVENNKVSKIFWEKGSRETGSVTEAFWTHEESLKGLWFTNAASALESKSQSENSAASLWGFDFPEIISNFVLKPSIPCGVLVIHHILPESEAPHWSSESTTKSFATNSASVHHSRFMARLAAEKLEAMMPPEQARVHKMNREMAERNAVHEGFMAEIAMKREREEKRIQEAIVSPKMGNKVVAEACLRWLIEKEEVGKEWSIERVAEAVLYLFVLDQREDGEAQNIVKVLEEWMSWFQVGGMKKAQVEMLGEKKVEFCLAACLVAVVAEEAGKPGNAGENMLECLKLWKKIRLG
jgi:hypothetical protein